MIKFEKKKNQEKNGTIFSKKNDLENARKAGKSAADRVFNKGIPLND